jgi:hypothetical protein
MRARRTDVKRYRHFWAVLRLGESSTRNGTIHPNLGVEARARPARHVIAI